MSAEIPLKLEDGRKIGSARVTEVRDGVVFATGKVTDPGILRMLQGARVDSEALSGSMTFPPTEIRFRIPDDR